MSFLRTTVTGSIFLPDGSVMPDGANIIFTLRSWDKDADRDAVALQGRIIATVEDGVISVELIRTASTDGQVTYDVGYIYRNQWTQLPEVGRLGVIAISGAADVDLADILPVPAPPPNVPDALAQAIAAAEDAMNASQEANTAALMALVGTGTGFDSVQEMIDSTIGYGVNSITHNGETVTLNVEAGDRWATKDGVFFDVLDAGASESEHETAGGVKLDEVRAYLRDTVSEGDRQSVMVKMREVQMPLQDFFKESEKYGDGKNNWTQAFERAQAYMLANSQKGELCIPPASIWCDGIDLYSQIRLKGRHRSATQIRQVDSAERAVIALADANQFQVGILDLSVVGNWDGSTVSSAPETGPRRGIDLDNQGGTGFPHYDPRHFIHAVDILNCRDLNLRIGLGGRETVIESVFCQTPGGWGAAIYATDMRVRGLTIGAPKLKGLYSSGANNTFIDVQCYGTASGIGVDARGDRDRYIGCGAQDNNGHGFSFASGAEANVVSSLVADSNTGAGFRFNGVQELDAYGLDSVTRFTPEGDLAGIGQHTYGFLFEEGTENCTIRGRSAGDISVYGGAGVTGNSLEIGDYLRHAGNLVARWGADTEVSIGRTANARAGMTLSEITLDRASATVAALSAALQIQGASSVRSGVGAPTGGAGGDVYFRKDGAVGSFIYGHIGGSWVALV